MDAKERKSISLKYGFSENLMDKIEHSIDLMRKAEPMALQFYPKGFYLAFSGGKDSQCLYHVAELAGVKFEANMNMTTIDPPEVVRFVNQYYPDVVKHVPDINFYDLVIKKKCLPSRRNRYCCDYLKERGGAGTVTLIGIRAEESRKRQARKEIETTKKRRQYTFDQFDEHKEQMVSCVGGEDKILISPILDWTTENVWEFLNKLGVKHCKIYDEGQDRIGCIYCPMAKVSEMEYFEKRYKHQTQKLKDAIRKLIEIGKYSSFNGDTELVFEWYKSKLMFEDFMARKNKVKVLREIAENLKGKGCKEITVSNLKSLVELPKEYRCYSGMLRGMLFLGFAEKRDGKIFLV